MLARLSPARLLLPAVALGMVILAGCQPGAADPTPRNSEQTTVPEEPAIEAPQVKAEPTAITSTAAVTLTDAIKNDASGETGGAAAAPEPGPGTANADVEFVRATQAADGAWRFDVTVRHPDTGWEDYADGWDVVTEDGLVLKANESDPFTRLLLHPHENEQPFTRSQSGIVVPDGVTVVVVRAHDLVDGFGGREVRVDLAGEGGSDFEVIRE